jgi:hypothetical protein
MNLTRRDFAVALSCASIALRSSSTACLTASSSSVAAIVGAIKAAALSANTREEEIW